MESDSKQSSIKTAESELGDDRDTSESFAKTGKTGELPPRSLAASDDDVSALDQASNR
jgi:hypothetical protein